MNDPVDLKLTHEPEWHGYQWPTNRPLGIYIGKLDYYSSICLYEVTKSGQTKVLCFFTNEEQAKQALWWLDALQQFFLTRSYNGNE